MKILKNKKIIEDLDLGVVSAGESKEFIFEVFNDGKGYLKELTFKVEHPEVKIIKAPLELNPYEKKEVTIKWSPAVDIEEGLKVKLSVEGKKIVKPI